MEEIGRSIIRLESVDSTNNYTANCGRRGELRHGAVIMAVEQTGGRGQMGTVWNSEAGKNLTFSVYLERVNLSVERQFILTKIVSLSLVSLLERYGIAAQIKWPNDIFVGDEKIAGVLIENTIQGNDLKRSIVGVGLNVNQENFGDLAATSFKRELGTHLSLEDVLFSFIGRFNAEIAAIDVGQLNKAYLRALYWLGESRVFRDATGEFQGIIRGVNDLGALMVDRAGDLRSYQLKEIAFIR